MPFMCVWCSRSGTLSQYDATHYRNMLWYINMHREGQGEVLLAIHLTLRRSDDYLDNINNKLVEIR